MDVKISRQCISGNPDNFTVSISFEYDLERLVAVYICKHILYGLLIGFNIYNNIKQDQAVYMGFLNHNKICDFDILNIICYSAIRQGI